MLETFGMARRNTGNCQWPNLQPRTGHDLDSDAWTIRKPNKAAFSRNWLNIQVSMSLGFMPFPASSFASLASLASALSQVCRDLETSSSQPFQQFAAVRQHLQLAS